MTEKISLVTNCQLAINKKVSTKDGALLKLITNQLKFKIIRFDPLIIEKDDPSHQDLLILFDSLRKSYGIPELKQKSSKTEENICMLGITDDQSASENVLIKHYNLGKENSENQTVARRHRCENKEIQSTSSNNNRQEVKKEYEAKDPNKMSDGFYFEQVTDVRSSRRKQEIKEAPVFEKEKTSHFNQDGIVASDIKNLSDHTVKQSTSLHKKDGRDISSVLQSAVSENLKINTEKDQTNELELQSLNVDVNKTETKIEKCDSEVISQLQNKTALDESTEVLQDKATLKQYECKNKSTRSSEELGCAAQYRTDSKLEEQILDTTCAISRNETVCKTFQSFDKNVSASSLSVIMHDHENKKDSFTYSQMTEKDSGYAIISNKSKLKVFVYKASIVELEVDCIVNAANGELQHWGGVAHVISKSAGPDLREECEDYIKTCGPIGVTEIFVSTAGRLPSKYVIHAVGPKWDSYDAESKSRCFDDLRYTVLRCLSEAGRLGLASVALPSISAAIFRVPRDHCARCYMEAVKHFDIFNADEKSTLQEIHFVDVDETMVEKITDCFTSDWAKPADLDIVHQDIDFLRKYLYSASRKEADKYQNISEKETNSVALRENTLPSKPVVGHAHKSEQTSNEESEIGAVYQIGNITLLIDSRSAFEYEADIIITIGKPFDKLSASPSFQISSSIKPCTDIPYRKGIYRFFTVPDPYDLQSHMLCEVQPDLDNAEDLTEAFKNIEAAIQNFRIQDNNLRKLEKLVLTSSALYAEPNLNTKHKKKDHKGPNVKIVAEFAQKLHRYLKKFSDDFQESTMLIIAACENALPTIEKVMNLHFFGAKSPGKTIQETRSERKSEGAGCGNIISSYRQINQAAVIQKEQNFNNVLDKAVLPDTTCEFCGENNPCEPVTCCEKLLCQECDQNASFCPFCNKARRIIVGNQPPGEMEVCLISENAEGCEDIRTWKIDYIFPSGIQEDCHPNPGMTYEGIERTAYLPANELGFQVLLRLRLAFIRKLIFTIGYSPRRDSHNVIIWNGISHKTRLQGGRSGYPDANYLSQVQLDLANKGVHLGNLTEAERHHMTEFSYIIRNHNKFSDFDNY